MIKRVNFTGRRRIARHHVRIEVHNGRPATFNATIDLDGVQFPAGAKVYLELMSAGSSLVKRFDFGAAGAIVPPEDRRLTNLDPDRAFFALKVVDQSKRFGQILGIAENIRPDFADGEKDAATQGILPIVEAELGQQLWDIDFGEHNLCLRVNANVPGLVDRARWDPLFYAVVFPAVIRQVLDRAIRTNAEVDEASDKWPVLWLRFGKQLHPEQVTPPSGQEADEDRDDWIEAVVDAFCAKHALKDAFLKHLPRENGVES